MGCGASCHVLLCCRSTAIDDGDLGFDDGGDAHQPLDEALGHSFCYVRSSSPTVLSRSPSLHSASAAAAAAAAEHSCWSISGAAVSANSAAPISSFPDALSAPRLASAAFRGSSSFSAFPLQLAGAGGDAGAASGSDRGFFLSGPIERTRSALSGPLDSSVSFSGPISRQKRRRRIWKPPSLVRRSLSDRYYPWVAPLRMLSASSSASKRRDVETSEACASVQWAHGQAGEDRVHVVVSEEHQWLFVGIYDGFNGPDAPEFLVSRLYTSLFEYLRGLFWEEVGEGEEEQEQGHEQQELKSTKLWEFLKESDDVAVRDLDFSGSGRFSLSLAKLRSGVRFPSLRRSALVDKEIREDRQLKERISDRPRRRRAGPVGDHGLVLRALLQALEDKEMEYLEMTSRVIDCNPELALTGACLLAVLMRDDDVYVMNVGDSRAIVAQSWPLGLDCEDEDGARRNTECGENQLGHSRLVALQLSTDHSTSIEEEVLRIKEEHPDDNQCIVNDRVKGRLKVTRAFGAGFLKRPELNNGLLEIFRNDYIGTAPYVSCLPSLRHHKLGPNDQFLVLSSDGLYQYLSNEEVVLHVVSFMDKYPDGDPAQSLIEELLYRAAEKAGMDFHELLEIPHGDRRKYHDDITVMVISFEGKIWKSSGKYL